MNILVKDQITRDIFLASALLNGTLLIFTGIVIPKLPPVIPLLYSRPWGEEQLTPQLFALALPLSLFIFLLLNLLLGRKLSNNLSLDDSKGAKDTQQTGQKQILLILRTLSVTSLFATIVGSITLLRITLTVV